MNKFSAISYFSGPEGNDLYNSGTFICDSLEEAITAFDEENSNDNGDSDFWCHFLLHEDQIAAIKTPLGWQINQ